MNALISQNSHMNMSRHYTIDIGYKMLGSQRDRAAGCVIDLAKSGRLELGDNILCTL